MFIVLLCNYDNHPDILYVFPAVSMSPNLIFHSIKLFRTLVRTTDNYINEYINNIAFGDKHMMCGIYLNTQ